MQGQWQATQERLVALGEESDAIAQVEPMGKTMASCCNPSGRLTSFFHRLNQHPLTLVGKGTT